MSQLSYYLQLYNSDNAQITSPLTGNAYSFQLSLSPESGDPPGMGTFYLQLQNTSTSQTIYFKSTGNLSSYAQVDIFAVIQGQTRSTYTFTAAGYYQVILCQYIYGIQQAVINIDTLNSNYTVSSNYLNISLDISPTALVISQQYNSFVLTNPFSNIDVPPGDVVVSIGELGQVTANNTPASNSVQVFASQYWPIVSNTIANYGLSGVISSAYVFDVQQDAYVLTNPVQYYFYNVNFTPPTLPVQNFTFDYIFSYWATTGNLVNVVVQNSSYQLQLVFDETPQSGLFPPPGNTVFTIIIQEPSEPYRQYTLTGSTTDLSSYLVYLTYNNSNYFTFGQSGVYTVPLAFYTIGTETYNINLAQNIYVTSDELSVTLELVPNTIELNKTYRDFTITSLFQNQNNPTILPNGNYEIHIGTYGPFTGYVPYSNNLLDWQWDQNLHNPEGLISTAPNYYLIRGVINNSSIYGQNYKYNITFIDPYVNSNLVCYHINTKVCCLEKDTEVFIPIQNIKKDTLVKTCDGTYRSVRHLVFKTIHHKKDNHKYNKLFKIPNYDLVVTGGHSLLLDSLNDYQTKETLKIWKQLKMIGEKFLCLSFLYENATEFDYVGETAIYHIVLDCSESDQDAQYGILVSGRSNSFGIWSESLSLSFLKKYANMNYIF
jgi:hypothetical protein